MGQKQVLTFKATIKHCNEGHLKPAGCKVGTVVKKKKRPLIVPQKVETNTINSKLNTITAASIQQGRDAVKSQKVNLAFRESLTEVLEQK